MHIAGSRWDTVLRWAEFFVLQVSNYSSVVGPFIPESKTAAQLIWTASRSLLELGPEKAIVLDVFRTLYRLGLSLAVILRGPVLLSANGPIRK